MVNAILIQAGAYGAVILVTILGMATMFRGYFWKYIKVRTSFGKYLMVKIRSTMRDYFAIGWVEDGFLCYKAEDKSVIRIAINTKDRIIYRCSGVNWVDVDDERHAICRVDYSAVSGFDSKKFSDLLTRALMRPSITSGQEKIILFASLGALIAAAAAAYLAYLAYGNTQTILKVLPTIQAAAKAAAATI